MVSTDISEQRRMNGARKKLYMEGNCRSSYALYGTQ